MLAIIHSIHSQVPRTVSRLDEFVESYIGMDSHLDVSLGMDNEVLPEELRLIARRTSAHTDLRRLLGDFPALRKGEDLGDAVPFTIAIPEGMIAKHGVDTLTMINYAGVGSEEHEDPIAFYSDFLNRVYDIRTFISPPLTLIELQGSVKGLDSWLLDIDVDYIHEFQAECYTPITNAKPGDLQWLAHVLRFIQKSNPSVITLSEAKVSAIRNPNSAFSKFVGRLKSLGYRIEEGALVETDEDTIRGIALCEEFYKKEAKGIAIRRLARGDDDFTSDLEEERIAARRFFSEKGFHYES